MSESQIIDFSGKTQNPSFASVFDVSPDEVKAHQSKVHLVDVRQPDEFIGNLGHIPGAELVPLGILPQKLMELPKSSTIIFVCRSGNRSAHAAAFAQENGFESVYNMQGGMILWNEKGFEVSTEE